MGTTEPVAGTSTSSPKERRGSVSPRKYGNDLPHSFRAKAQIAALLATR